MYQETLEMQSLKKLLRENIKDESRLDDDYYHGRVSAFKFVLLMLDESPDEDQ
jgi:hypothetical protein